MVLQVQGLHELQVFQRGAVPRVQERKRRIVLPSAAGVALVAQQGREVPPRTRPDDPLLVVAPS